MTKKEIDIDNEIEKRWDDFYEWLDTCPVRWTEGRHPTSGMTLVNFDLEDEWIKEKPKEIPQEDWVKGYNKWKKTQ